LKESHEHIGNIYLREIDWVSRTAKLEVFIGNAENRGRGFGEEAVRQVLEYAFDTLGLRRVYLTVLAFNEAATTLYKKCGFREEGRLRQHVFKQGKYEDLLVMGVLRDEL